MCVHVEERDNLSNTKKKVRNEDIRMVQYITLNAVSYTHLDVYKRQPLFYEVSSVSTVNRSISVLTPLLRRCTWLSYGTVENKIQDTN